MTRLWNFLSSTVLTIVLAILICLNAVWGSLLTVDNPEFYSTLDSAILLPALGSMGSANLSLTLWIYILIVLVALFALNTFVCTIDRVYAIIRKKSPWQMILPHIVHVGFLIAALGHLLGSTYGFKSPDNLIMTGLTIPVPTVEGLKVRLDEVDVKATPDRRGIESLKTTVTLIEGDREVLTGVIEINGPLIYKGIAFYHINHGQMPTGLLLRAGNALKRVAFDSGFQVTDILPKAVSFRLGAMYPDFALDSSGSAYSRSGNFRNPYQEIISDSGERGYLNISRPGGSVTVDNVEIVLEDYMMSTYAVLAINKDPGIGLIIAGSLVLCLGIILIFIFRGGKSELMQMNRETIKT